MTVKKKHAFSRGILQPDEYMEPRCLLCEYPGSDTSVISIPQQRIIEKLDEYMSRRDYAGAQRHLLYWLEEAIAGGDRRGELLVRGELIGHFRKTMQEEKGMEQISRALELIPLLHFENTVSAATAYVNAATACQAFNRPERALALFEQARTIYENHPQTRPELLGGLYNNMALTLTSLGRYEEAYALYDKAMQQMSQVRGGVLEQAITCLNRADTLSADVGMEEAEKEISIYLDQAWELLNDPDVVHDGYYAFVCEKCAPSFSYYGYFLAAQECSRRAEKIYERA